MTAPEQTALLFVECQRGVVGDLSVLPALAESARPALAAMGRLATGARAAGVQVAHLTYLPDARGRTANRRAPLLRATTSTAEWSDAHPAAQVVPEIGVAPGDLVLPRRQGISPVHRTEVLPILRNLGIEEVVVAGVVDQSRHPPGGRGRCRRGLRRDHPDRRLGRHPARAPRLGAGPQPGLRGPPGDRRRLLAEWAPQLSPRARRWPSSRGIARTPRCRTGGRCRCPCSPRRASPPRTTCRR